MKKIISVIGLLLLGLASVVLVRTAMFAAEVGEEIERVSVAVDEARVTRHMAEAIAFRTVATGDPVTQDYEPFRAFVAWVAQTYPEVQEQLGLEMLGEHTMLYKWQGTNAELKPILLTAHYDVVPVVPSSETAWTHPPFSGAISGGYVWGRGALDDKSGVIVMLEALTLLLEEGFLPERTVYFSYGHDEETGGHEGAGSVADHLEASGVRLTWSLDEGSFIARGVMPGMAKPVASINVAEKGSMTLDLVAHAPGGHSSMPADELSVDILAQALVKLRRHPVPGGLEGVAAEMIEGVGRHGSFVYRMLVANRWLFGRLIEKQLSASGRTNALLRTTTAPTMLAAGIKTNVIPPTATATVNFRLHPRDTVEGVTRHVISAIEDERVEVKIRPGGLSALASRVSSRDSGAYKMIAKVARQTYGDLVVVPGLTGGGTDSKHYGRVADDSYRFQFMMVSPEDISGFHGINERVSTDNLVRGTGAYYLLLKEAAGER
jgi:carboxypeptidase PM20D1